jgi:hypothetical protein
MIFYQGLARLKLEQVEAARGVFGKLVDYGRSHLHDEVKMDYFAVSLPDFLVFEDDLTQRNQIHCHYMMALGLMGLGEVDEARAHFSAVLAMDANHVGTAVHWQML